LAILRAKSVLAGMAGVLSVKLAHMIHHHCLIATVLLASAGVSQDAGGTAVVESSARQSDGLPKLAAPFLVEADGKPIATKVGHAAPFVTDLDGDGVWDLAVGEFGGGGCRLYKNLGTAKEPKFGSFSMLLSDGKPAAMESS
jgi:hypothetical protein